MCFFVFVFVVGFDTAASSGGCVTFAAVSKRTFPHHSRFKHTARFSFSPRALICSSRNILAVLNLSQHYSWHQKTGNFGIMGYSAFYCWYSWSTHRLSGLVFIRNQKNNNYFRRICLSSWLRSIFLNSPGVSLVSLYFYTWYPYLAKQEAHWSFTRA